MTDPDVYVPYRVMSTSLAAHPLTGRERVIVTAADDAGDLLIWTAQPDRAPSIGVVMNVTMHQQAQP